ncbi:hydrogenase maturation protease [Frankia canadensis]|uniref:hydrogenase maturation protease n=1 Tax=Frankia canadensis TaxID=1836972 RepID=UPI000C7ADDC9|nr:hydrogenase maturation protease [Frankia canadensis]
MTARGAGGPGASRTLVVGVGNVFLGDDGFGVEVARRIDPGSLPAGVEVADYGIRGVHLAYTLLDGQYDRLVLADAVRAGGPPGTLTVLRPDPAGPAGDTASTGDTPVLDAHGLSPDAVLGLLRTLGGEVAEVLVVGCEPAVVAERMELSPQVRAAVDAAVALIDEIVRDPRLAAVGPDG